MPFNIVSQEVTDQVAKMTLSGELDASSAAIFQAGLDKAFLEKPRHLVLFVADLSFLASVGIRVLLFAKKQIRGLDIYLIAPQEGVVETLSRANMPVIVQDVYQPQS